MLLNPAREPPTSLRVPGRAPGAQPGARPGRLAQQALAWFEAELETLLAVTHQAAQAGFDTETCLLAWSLADFLDRRGRWRDWVLAQEAALTAARRLGDDALQARTERSLGRACTELGPLPEAQAHLERALALSRTLADGAGQANTYLAMATVSEYQGAFGQALDQVEQALGLLEEAGDKTGQARALNGVGWFHAQLGHHGEALRCCEQALDALPADQGPPRRGRHLRQHRPRPAAPGPPRGGDRRLPQRCLEMLPRASATWPNAVETLSRLGDCYRAVGDDDGGPRGLGAGAGHPRRFASVPFAAGGRGALDAAPAPREAAAARRGRASPGPEAGRAR